MRVPEEMAEEEPPGCVRVMKPDSEAMVAIPGGRCFLVHSSGDAVRSPSRRLDERWERQGGASRRPEAIALGRVRRGHRVRRA